METIEVTNTALMFAPEPPVLPEDKSLVDSICDELSALAEKEFEWEQIREYVISKYGLVCHDKPCYKEWALIGDKFVVKTSWIIASEKPAGTIYTREFKTQNNRLIFVQPRVNTKRKEFIQHFLSGIHRKLFGRVPTDMHYGNVGEYNGHAVIFDW